MSSGAGESGGTEAELNREIGILGAVALGVGTMIAAGIFVLSGLAVSNVGAVAVVSFLIAAGVASFTAFAYAEFAAIYPESGGGYMYVANVFDTDLTYIVGWSIILGYPASAAFYLASFSDWFFRFIYPVLDIPAAIPYWVSGLLILALLVAVNLKGTKETGLFQIVVTALKVALILVFLYGGLQAWDSGVIATSVVENIDRIQQIGLTSALVFITFFGFEAIATNAEEIKQPGRTVPRAIFISMGFVTLIYVLVVAVVVLAVNDPPFLQFLADKAGLPGPGAAEEFVRNNGEVSMGRAAQYYLGDIGFYVIIVGALFSMLSAANATIMAGSRVKLAMARRNHLPGKVEEVHSRFETPYAAVLMTGGLILLFIMVFSVVFGEVPGATESSPPFGLHLGIEAIAHFADFMLLIGLIFVNIAVVQSRRKNPEVDRPFRVPGVPWVPALAVLANLALLVNVEFKSLVLGVMALLTGVLFWGFWKGPTLSTEHPARETPTVVAEHTPSEADYTILVPVANPGHVDQLMRTADDIAMDRGGEVVVMSVVELPEQTPLEEGRQFVDEKRSVVEKAMRVAEEADVPVSASIKIAHHAGDAILNTVEEYDADSVLMGWRGHHHHRRDIVLGTTVDEVVMEAKCDVLVEKIGGSGDVESILLPTAGGPHSELAAEVSRSIAHSNDADVKVVTVVDPDVTEADRRDAESVVGDTAELLGDVVVEQELIMGDDVVKAIAEESRQHDLTVIGATRQGVLQQLVFGTIPEAVGRQVESTVIMTKRNLGIPSRLSRWFGFR